MAARMEQLGAFVRARRQDRGLSLRRLSEASGISNPYLSQIERGLRKPSAEVLQHIGRALALPVEDLYVRAGILPAGADGARPDRSDDLEGRIRREPGLTDAQRDALVDLYRSFVAATPPDGV